MSIHYSTRHLITQLLMAALFTMAMGLTFAANAQETTYDASFSSSSKEGIPINVLVGQSRVINFDRSIGRFSISNPEVAEAVMVSPNQVLVNGKTFGQVNFKWDKNSLFSERNGHAPSFVLCSIRVTWRRWSV